MLNEFLEFKAYVTEPEAEQPRIMPLALTEHFKDKNYLIGIEEIMTVIARAYIFSDVHKRYDESGKINENLIADTIELLHRWTGFQDAMNRKRTDNSKLDQWMDKHLVVDGWLKRFWLFQIEKKKPKSAKEERWLELEEKWNKSFNSPMDYQAGKITYHNVIANALEKGPLRNRYLVIRKSPEQIEKKVRAIDDESFNYLINVSGMHETTKMKFLKIIAVYLINLEYHPKGQKEVWIKNNDLSRWYALDDGKNGSKALYPEKIKWNDKPVYIREGLRAKCIKVVVNPDYLKEFDFHIIDVADVDKYKDTHWILEDLGHGLKDCWDIKI